MRTIFFLFLFPLALVAQGTVNPRKSPQQINEELISAEAQFTRAKGMFNPWYAGPLVTPSASMMPPGSANIQPYLYITGNYASFNSERKSIPLIHNSYQLQLIAPMQIGVTDSTDISVTVLGTANWKNHHSGIGFGDVSVTYGFSIFKETLYIPKFKFTVTETFPTGKYKHLYPTGLNGTGGGSYQTRFGLATGKVIWWTYPYVMNVRLFLGYNVPTVVSVSGFNSYGGGFGTKGRVHPGNTFFADFGYELTFSQNWVFAMDVVYSAQNRTQFNGTPGLAASGASAVVGSPYNDNLSLAPAIEYNFNEALAILWGVQFSVYGRNSTNFVNGQFSVEYQW